MKREGSKTEYSDYLEQELAQHKAKILTGAGWKQLDRLDDMEIRKVIDIGCGAGQQLLPYTQMGGIQCIGIDVMHEAGEIFSKLHGSNDGVSKATFIRSSGEEIPFDNNTFDVAICRVALPYMDNGKAIAEIARVLRPGGRLFLKTHTPMFYIGMIKRRLKTMSPKQLIYPAICLAGGVWHWVTGKMPRSGIWKGKEVFQTTGIIKRKAERSGMTVVKEEVSRDREAKSYIIEKSYLCNLIAACYAELDTLSLGLFAIH